MSNALVHFNELVNDIEKSNMAKRFAAEFAAEVRDSGLLMAAVHGERVALRRALSKFDPNHPLLKDESLQDKIRDAAKRAYRGDNIDWDLVGQAGASVPYDYTPPLASKEEENIQNYAEKHALRRALERIDRHHPLLFPKPEESPLVAGLRKAGLMAYTFSKSYAAVAEVGQKFPYPEHPYLPKKPTEVYYGEIEALEKRLAYLKNPRSQEVARLVAEHAAKTPK